MKVVGAALGLILLAVPALSLGPGNPLSCTASADVNFSCPGIRPGAAMTGPSGCTMNFVFSSAGNLFIGTAAHCVSSVGQRVSMSGVGSMGAVYFIGLDFALVKIDKSKEGLVNPAMCLWGGPIGMAEGNQIGRVPMKHYGFGLGFGILPQTRGRIAMAQTWNNYTLNFDGGVIFGDSGSPIMTHDGLAAGSISSIGPTLGTGLMHAQRITKGIQLAEQTLGQEFTLMTAPLAV